MSFVLFVLLLAGSLPAAGEDLKPGAFRAGPAESAARAGGAGEPKAPAARPFHPLLTQKPPKAPRAENPQAAEAAGAYSFRPLLIQGKKHLFDQSKDMRVEGESLAESELFSLKIDFKGKALKMLPEGEGAEK